MFAYTQLQNVMQLSEPTTRHDESLCGVRSNKTLESSSPLLLLILNATQAGSGATLASQGFNATYQFVTGQSGFVPVYSTAHQK